MGKIDVKLTKEEKLKLLDNNIREFFNSDKQVKELQNVQKQLRQEIMDLLKDKDVCEARDYDNGEFHAYIYQGTNTSLKAKLVEENLKVKVTDNCYNVTTYDALKVEKSKKNDKEKSVEQASQEIKFNVDL